MSIPEYSSVSLKVRHAGWIPKLNIRGPLAQPVTTSKALADELIAAGYKVSYQEPIIPQEDEETTEVDVVTSATVIEEDDEDEPTIPDTSDDETDEDSEEEDSEGAVTKEDVEQMSKKQLVELVEANSLDIPGYKNLTVKKLRTKILELMD